MKGERPGLSALPARARTAVAAARELARAQGVRLYLAGGVVRDLLWKRPIRDLDLVVEGPAGDFGRSLARRLGAALRVHDRFGTVKLELPDGSRLDIAQTRQETYASPGALPTVSLGASIEQDLARRDFTVNAMALEISPGRRLVDPFGGSGDLKRGIIRALHAGSFRDDPTRAFRAVRYANRLGFRVDPATARAIREAVRGGAFAAVSGDRLRRELEKIFSEPGRASAVHRVRHFALDAAIDPGLAGAPGAVRRVRAAEAMALGGPAGVTWLCYLLAWMTALSASTTRRVASRLNLASRDRERLSSWPRTSRHLGRGLAGRRPSEIARLMGGLSADEVVAGAATLGSADRRTLLKTLGGRAAIRLRIRGSDLIAAGLLAGKAIGQALARTLNARLDGKISAEEELEFAVRAAGRRAFHR